VGWAGFGSVGRSTNEYITGNVNGTGGRNYRDIAVVSPSEPSAQWGRRFDSESGIPPSQWVIVWTPSNFPPRAADQVAFHAPHPINDGPIFGF